MAHPHGALVINLLMHVPAGQLYTNSVWNINNLAVGQGVELSVQKEINDEFRKWNVWSVSILRRA